MNKLNSIAIRAKIYGENALSNVRTSMMQKKNGDETLLVKIMLMVIAVVLVILFRDTLKNIITTLLTQVQEKIQGMYNTTTQP